MTEEEKELTFKQSVWLREYLVDGNATRAALVAYYPEFPVEITYKDLTDAQKDTYNAAGVMGYENLKKLNMPVSELMDRMGLTMGRLMRKLEENTEAVKPYGTQLVEYPDTSGRNKALEIAMKVRGALTEQPVKIELGFFSEKQLKIREVKDDDQTEHQTTPDPEATE